MSTRWPRAPRGYGWQGSPVEWDLMQLGNVGKDYSSLVGNTSSLHSRGGVRYVSRDGLGFRGSVDAMPWSLDGP